MLNPVQGQATCFFPLFSPLTPGNVAQKRAGSSQGGGGNSNPGHRSDGVTCVPASLGRLPCVSELGAPRTHRPLISLLHSTLCLSRIIQSSWQRLDWARSILVPSGGHKESDYMYRTGGQPASVTLFISSSSSHNRFNLYLHPCTPSLFEPPLSLFLCISSPVLNLARVAAVTLASLQINSISAEGRLLLISASGFSCVGRCVFAQETLTRVLRFYKLQDVSSATHTNLLIW